jgi:hypothetical protein
MDLDRKDGDWQSIAEQASKEMDGAKLTILVAQLCRALDERDKRPESAIAVESLLPASPAPSGSLLPTLPA